MHAAVPLRVVPGEDRVASPIGADSPHLQAPAMHHDPSGAAVQAQSPWFGTDERRGPEHLTSDVGWLGDAFPLHP